MKVSRNQYSRGILDWNGWTRYSQNMLGNITNLDYINKKKRWWINIQIIFFKLSQSIHPKKDITSWISKLDTIHGLRHGNNRNHIICERRNIENRGKKNRTIEFNKTYSIYWRNLTCGRVTFVSWTDIDEMNKFKEQQTWYISQVSNNQSLKLRFIEAIEGE